MGTVPIFTMGLFMRLALASVAIIGHALVSAGQPVARDPGVLRIAVDLVQVDATVTDERGRHVADLSAADFEVLQDGRPQTISTFAYVPTASVAATARPAPRAPSITAPSAPLKPEQVRRTMALVVDDLGLSFEGTVRVRDVLRRFVDTQMQSGDLVAILRTGAGMGALQQFTPDRRMLHAAIEGVRWNMLTRVAPFQAATDEDQRLDEMRNELFSAGTLGAIKYVVRGLADLPGRKSVILLSEGFGLKDADGYHGRVLDALRSLVDAANRAGVVIYTIDTRGLVVTAPSAADDVSRLKPAALMDAKRDELMETQDGLGLLAHETGGLFMRNTNDIGGAVERALDDQQGYYLLGYVPDASTFGAARPKFHRLQVRMKRPGLRVRSRSGFLGVPDTTMPRQTPANRMVASVTSPFAGGKIRLRLSSFFGHVPKVGAVVHSVMHVDARDLMFAEQPDGTRTAELETLAVTFGENGQVADQNNQRYTVKLPPDVHARALERGFVYRLQVPLKRSGPYQLRIALRDVGSDRIGSASQFIDVPDVKKGRLTLSGLAIEGLAQRKQPSGPGGGGAPPLDNEATVEEIDPGATLALRTFRQGTNASYACFVYNARRGRDGQPQLEAETRIYRDGREVFRSEPSPVLPATATGAPTAGGVLQMGREMPPGSYVLEIAVIDRLAKKASRATQTIDFDVIP